MTRRTQLLEREEPEAFVEIHPKSAKDLGIRNDEPVLRLHPAGGSPGQSPALTDVVASGRPVHAVPLRGGERNVLTNNVLDPLAKIPEFKVCAANVEEVRMTTMKVITEPRLVEAVEGIAAEYQVYVPVRARGRDRVMGDLTRPGRRARGQVAAKPTGLLLSQMDTLFHSSGSRRDEPGGKGGLRRRVSAADAEGLAFIRSLLQCRFPGRDLQ